MLNDLLVALLNLTLSLLSPLIAVTVLLYLFRVFVPWLGEPLWRLYTRFLGWLLVAPFRLMGYVFRLASDALKRRA
ncbi:hypothetical protein AB0M43_35450 [Longispora sp. NPDC051575]|uniref:hypothetical protein n=1 Tax=Longispora sp. NPDC051575 TaxID=3154943 RepID=UPI00341DC7B9